MKRLLLTTIMLLTVTVFGQDYSWEASDTDYSYDGVQAKDYSYQQDTVVVDYNIKGVDVKAGYGYDKYQQDTVVADYTIQGMDVKVVYEYDKNTGLKQRFIYIKNKRFKSLNKARKALEYIPEMPSDVSKNRLGAMTAWTKRYENQTPQVNYVEWNPTQNLHMVSAGHQTNVDKLVNNTDTIQEYKKRGFDGIVLVWRNTPAGKMKTLCRRLQENGFTVAVAYDPKAKAGVWVSPGHLKGMVKAVKKYVDAWILTWRKTTAGHWQGNHSKYTLHTADIIRDAAPEMPLMGEAYLKNMNDLRISGVGYASGYIIMNAGRAGIIPESIIDRVREKTERNVPLLYGIEGPHTDYVGPDYESTAEKRRAAERIRERALEGGIQGTFTFPYW